MNDINDANRIQSEPNLNHDAVTTSNEEPARNQLNFTDIKNSLNKIIEFFDKHNWAGVLAVAIIYSICHYFTFSYFNGFLSYYSIDASNIEFDLRTVIYRIVPVCIMFITVFIKIHIIKIQSTRYVIVESIVFISALIVLFFLYLNIKDIAIYAFITVIILLILNLVRLLTILAELRYKKARGNNCNKTSVRKEIDFHTASIFYMSFLVVILIIILFAVSYAFYYQGQINAKSIINYTIIKELNYAIVYETSDNYFCVPYTITSDGNLELELGTSIIIEKNNIEITTFNQN